MILPLRRRHRAMLLTLSIIIPATFALGLAARKAVPTVPTLPAQIVGEQRQFGLVRWVREDLWTNGMRTTLLADEATPFAMAIQFSTKVPISRPDVIVYWAPSKELVRDKLPEDALLLGSFVQGSPVLLPKNANSDKGILLLYSLADQEIVAVSKPFALNSQPSTLN